MIYLDLLPKEINDLIYNNVEKLYQIENKERFKCIIEEIDNLWLYSLWAAGFKNNNLIDNIYHKNFKFNMNNDKFKKLIIVTKNIDYINFIKPSFIKHIKCKSQTTPKQYPQY